MSRIIIIEGTDGTGKTTYAKSLAEAHGGVYRHAGAPTAETWWEEYLDPLSLHLTGPEAGQLLVLDRWHLGEMVWPSLFGRPSLFGQGQEAVDAFCELNRELLALGVPIELVVVFRDAAGIRDTLTERGEPIEDIERSLAGQTELLSLGLSAMCDPLHVELVHSDDLPTAPRGRNQ